MRFLAIGFAVLALMAAAAWVELHLRDPQPTSLPNVDVQVVQTFQWDDVTDTPPPAQAALEVFGTGRAPFESLGRAARGWVRVAEPTPTFLDPIGEVSYEGTVDLRIHGPPARRLRGRFEGRLAWRHGGDAQGPRRVSNEWSRMLATGVQEGVDRGTETR